MSRGHRPVIGIDSAGRFYVRCNCKATSGPNNFLKRQHAEDWVIAHQREVERAQANLRRGRGSLRIERDHAKKMMDDPNTPPADREQWRILYEGAVSRLGTPDPQPKKEGLW